MGSGNGAEVAGDSKDVMSRASGMLNNEHSESDDEQEEDEDGHEDIGMPRRQSSRKVVSAARVDAGVGAHAVAQLLTLNRSLTSLDLSYNSFGGAALIVIAQGFTENTSLVSLRFSGNPSSVEGVRMLGRCLVKARNSGLERLTMHKIELPVKKLKGIVEEPRKESIVR